MQFTRWDQVVNTESTDAILQELALWHWSQLSKAAIDKYGPIGQAVIDRDVRSLIGFELDYSSLGVADAIHLRQILAFFSKRQDVDGGTDKTFTAWLKFQASERVCRETNEVFRSWASGGFQFPPDVEQVLHTATRKIAQCLGDLPNLAALKAHFGPGATTQVKKTDASPRAKLGQVFACSEEFAENAVRHLRELPGWLQFNEGVEVTDPTAADFEEASTESLCGDDFDYYERVRRDDPNRLKDLFRVVTSTATTAIEIHRGRLCFVPKNALTYRSVIVEPSLNSMFQLGIGEIIAQRLARKGVDIRDQTRNKRLALEASLTGEFATLDLSSASDTIARELVFHLLPIDWALYLDSLCTRHVDFGEYHVPKLQKFSSMGNGFTFPLETLIFWALATSCSPGREADVSVYGDDIIVPTDVYPFLTRVLTACGFEVNQSKSFASGPFRESCGGDYLSGIDIRPCYIKEPLSGSDMFRLHNFYVRTFQPEPAAIVLNHIAEPLRIWGPDGYGDGHLIGDWLPVHHNRDRGWSGFTFDTYTWVTRKSVKSYPGDHVFPIYSIYVSTTSVRTRNERIAVPPWAIKWPDVPYWRNLKKDFVDAALPEGNCISDNSVAPDNQGVMYVRKRKSGKSARITVVPGVSGYKRIKIYTLSS